MKITICEDDRYWVDRLKTAISNWAVSRKIELECNSFLSPQELLSYLNEGCDIDALLLDIELGKEVIDGMALAVQIRKKGLATPIIFVTSDSSRAADGYLVEAVGYIHKPNIEDRLNLFLDKICKRETLQKTIKVMEAGQVANINLKDIIYAEICDHVVIYHTTQGAMKHRGTFGEILENLRDNSFVQIHRSFMVALDKIRNIKTKYPYSVDMLMNHEVVTLSVSRKYIGNLLEAYSEDLMENML